MTALATKQTKHIFVTGGVVSSLGKGLTAASIGMLLDLRVTAQLLPLVVLIATLVFAIKVLTGALATRALRLPAAIPRHPAGIPLAYSPRASKPLAGPAVARRARAATSRYIAASTKTRSRFLVASRLTTLATPAVSAVDSG